MATAAVLLGWSLLAPTEVWAEPPVIQVVQVTPAPVQLNIRSDDPGLKFVIIRPSPVDSAEYDQPDQIVWQASGSSRASLFPGRYRLRTVTRTSYIERDLEIVDDTALEVVSPSSSARSSGLGAGIAGSMVAGVAGFFLFAGALGYMAGDCFGDCHRLSDTQKIVAGALVGAVAVGGTVAALGFRAYFRNRWPRVEVVPPSTRSQLARTLSLEPARMGNAWAIAGGGTF
jgi:hypothetical protein